MYCCFYVISVTIMSIDECVMMYVLPIHTVAQNKDLLGVILLLNHNLQLF